MSRSFTFSLQPGLDHADEEGESRAQALRDVELGVTEAQARLDAASLELRRLSDSPPAVAWPTQVQVSGRVLRERANAAERHAQRVEAAQQHVGQLQAELAAAKQLVVMRRAELTKAWERRRGFERLKQLERAGQVAAARKREDKQLDEAGRQLTQRRKQAAL